jgi:hypothetical protein
MPIGFETVRMAGVICKRAALLQQGVQQGVQQGGVLADAHGKQDAIMRDDPVDACDEPVDANAATATGGGGGGGGVDEADPSRDIGRASYCVGIVASTAAAGGGGSSGVEPTVGGDKGIDGSMRNALFDAVVAADVEGIKRLVRRGADISERSTARVRRGCTVLYIACRGGEEGGTGEMMRIVR